MAQLCAPISYGKILRDLHKFDPVDVQIWLARRVRQKALLSGLNPIDSRGLQLCLSATIFHPRNFWKQWPEAEKQNKRRELLRSATELTQKINAMTVEEQHKILDQFALDFVNCEYPDLPPLT